MDLTPYLENLRRDLAAAAAPGGPDISRAAELLAGSLDSAVRLCLMQALADAAAEVTTQLRTAAVEVRLRGRDPDLVVTEIAAEEPAEPPMTPPVTSAEPSGDVTRITLRLPESLKDDIERVAANEGISVNSWLVRAATGALQGPPPGWTVRTGSSRRITGFARS